MPRPRDRSIGRSEILAVVGLVLLPVLIFGRALLPGKVLSPADILFLFYPWKATIPGQVPANPQLSDVAFIFHPWLVYAGERIRGGDFPLWNPHALAGAPFFANAQSGLLFPLNALAYVLPAPLALTLISILKLVAAGLGMYWFLRMLSLGWLAAVAGASTFMLNGLLIVWLQWSFGSVVVMLPFFLGMTERLRERGGLRAVAGLALVAAITILAGYPQAALHASLAAGVWALSRARRATGGGWRFLGRFALGVALGAALAAIQLIPFIEYLRASSILASRAQGMPLLTLPLRSAITLLLPHYYGSPVGGDFWGPSYFNEISASVGLLPWLVLPPALLVAWRRTGTRFFAGMALLAGAMVFNAPGITRLAGLPPLSLAANHRIFPLFVFALCALGARGVDALVAVPRDAPPRVKTAVKVAFVVLVGIAFVFVVRDYPRLARTPMKVSVLVQYTGFLLLLTLTTLIVLRCLHGQGRRVRQGLALVACQGVSLLPLAATHIPVIDTRLFYPSSAVIDHLRRQTAQDHARVVGDGAWNIGMLHGLFEVTGYDGMTPRRVEEVVGPGSLGPIGNGPLHLTTGFGSPLFDLLGIRYVVVAAGASSPSPHFSLDYDGPDARVYRNDRALPRVFLVGHARPCVGEARGLALMRAGQIDFRSEALIAECKGVDPAGPPGRVSRAEILDYSAQRVVISAATDSPAYLVLTDTWFPGWRVWVNGGEQRVWRANHAFRAVRLPPGEHEVEFRYRPLSFQIGLGVSLLALGAVAGIGLAAAGPRRD